MDIVVACGSGRERRARVTAAQVRRLHPDATVTALVCAPRPLGRPVGFDRIVMARDLAPSRLGSIDVDASDIHLGWGPQWARWWSVVGFLGATSDRGAAGNDAASNGVTVVLPDHAVLEEPLDQWVAAVSDDALGLIGRTVTPDATLAIGGWIPEVVVVGAAAVDLCAEWAAVRADVLRRDRGNATPSDPWAAGPAGPRVVALAPPSGLRVLPGVDPATPWTAPEPDLPAGIDRVERHALVAARVASLDAAGPDDGPRWTSDPIASIASRTELGTPWRRQLLAASNGAATAPPNPYRAGQVQAYLEWTTGGGDPELTGISRVADVVWAARPDLAGAFGSPSGSGRHPFVRWMWDHGVHEGLVALPELPVPTAPPPRVEVVEHPPFGVNLVGYHGAQAGLGVAVRGVADALDAAGIDWIGVDNSRTASRRSADADLRLGPPKFRFNLLLMAPDQVPAFIAEAGPGFLANRYTIGLWYWETDRLNPAQARGLEFVDEIWGATDYLRRVFTAVGDVPVRRVPVPFGFGEPDRTEAARTRLGLDDRFTFLFTFDFLSVAARKNPTGAVEAFRRAFPEPGPQRLVLKAINGDRFPDVRDRLEWDIGDRPDIELWDRYLDAGDRLSLVALSDAYVSLHRSEGLGLTIAEAMAVGTPVIASRYSGNVDFCDDDSAWLIDGREILIGPGHHYPADGHWFDPDLDRAAAAMREVMADERLRVARIAAAHARIQEFTPSRCGAMAEARLRELWTSAAKPLVS